MDQVTVSDQDERGLAVTLTPTDIPGLFDATSKWGTIKDLTVGQIDYLIATRGWNVTVNQPDYLAANPL